MKLNLFNTHHSQLLKKALESYGNERAAIAKNIANVNNPDFKRLKTDFSDVLKSELNNSKLKLTDPKHLGSAQFKTQMSPPGEGEGEVDLTREMSDLAANQIKHEFVSKVLRRYYAGISSAIIGRNR